MDSMTLYVRILIMAKNNLTCHKRYRKHIFPSTGRDWLIDFCSWTLFTGLATILELILKVARAGNAVIHTDGLVLYFLTPEVL